jgi:hypothetical protein
MLDFRGVAGAAKLSLSGQVRLGLVTHRTD